jgi:class 3 adenylate cyclase/isopentenyldiphosphate isomerase
VTEAQNALVIFVDVRGFTKWSEANEVFINLERFVQGFLSILRKHFPGDAYKLRTLGDGALIIYELPAQQSQREVTALFGRTVTTIARVERDFAKHCSDFGRSVGHVADLRLGWGVVRGKILKVDEDWAGHNLNKCSRLCSEARPFGVVVDSDDFPERPKEASHLIKQVRRLRGIGEVSVWVSPEVATQFIPRERLRETPEVHVAGTCFREDANGNVSLLLARRSQERQLFPGKLEGCGGQLSYSESFTDGVRRHFRLELGIDVDVLDLHCFYEIRQPDAPVIPGIRFLCQLVGDNKPESANHSELMWVTEEHFRTMHAEDFVGHLKSDVIELLKRRQLIGVSGRDNP